MSQPTLYLFIGYPGAGKTTLARMIHEATGAVHLWADHERQKQFGQPTHSETESNELYRRLNDQTMQLLKSGQSVIFDTNFNFRKDRQYLRDIAERAGAQSITIWVTTSRELARQRAVHDDNLRNGYHAVMSGEQFDAIANKLQPPEYDEKIINIDGTQLDKTTALQQLGIV
ncbi:MAG TPA: ATP-binding protein [Candidatus Saccharimonadales bacterium]|nr:ATP-binding protein [Candidatus Saccharimonadales bacterium]